MSGTSSVTELVEDNRRHWDERVPINTASSFYDLDGFRTGAEDLDQFQLDELGDVISAVAGSGLRIEFVHEHDTIPFPRYGALVTDGTRFHYLDHSARLPLMYSLAATAPAR
ncbi:hypothetical protein FHX42_001999 [Saccharopolyspora lacisalsi]|uniref:Uncharacterized protein n=1 Tax=Halosaccharopolyspora lacisalsi TaxID=1000566 RepID=A0A839DRN8_9PSEU|nr:hypothetical protein [Halosaccharopolyspora lacisalsi]MBA8824652.1 hypothetical protein [Halosaccharopolyspora lacisalsi]